MKRLHKENFKMDDEERSPDPFHQQGMSPQPSPRQSLQSLRNDSPLQPQHLSHENEEIPDREGLVDMEDRQDLLEMNQEEEVRKIEDQEIVNKITMEIKQETKLPESRIAKIMSSIHKFVNKKEILMQEKDFELRQNKKQMRIQANEIISLQNRVALAGYEEWFGEDSSQSVRVSKEVRELEKELAILFEKLNSTEKQWAETQEELSMRETNCEVIKYELWKVIDRMNRKFHAVISLKEAEEVCQHLVKKLVNIQMEKLEKFQKYYPKGDVFQLFGRTRIFEELVKIDAKAIDELRYELIREADLMNESIMAEALLHFPNSDVLIWRERYWKFTRKSKLFLMCALCVDPPEMSLLIDIQQLFIALIHELNRKMGEEMLHIKNPYISQRKEELCYAMIKSTVWKKSDSYMRWDDYERGSLLLNERDYWVVKVYEKYDSEHESAQSYVVRCQLRREIFQKVQKALENASVSRKDTRRLLINTDNPEKKVGGALASADVSQCTHTVNSPVKKEQVVEAEKAVTSQTFDCFEANNEKEEDEVYQQCVKKTQLLDELRRFDFEEFYKKKENFSEKEIFAELLEEDYSKENKVVDESPDIHSLFEGSMSSTNCSSQLIRLQKEFTVHAQKNGEVSRISSVMIKSDTPLHLQKPGLQKQEDGACGGFSEKKTKRRSREEPRPRTDPPKGSDDISDHDIKPERCNLSGNSSDIRHFPDLSDTGNLNEHSSNAFIESIQLVKDSPTQVSPCDKEHQHVLKFNHHHDFYWSDTSSKLILEDGHHRSVPPHPRNLRTTYWRGAQEEHRPRKDPPTFVHHQHLPWLGHHSSTLIMAHG